MIWGVLTHYFRKPPYNHLEINLKIPGLALSGAASVLAAGGQIQPIDEQSAKEKASACLQIILQPAKGLKPSYL